MALTITVDPPQMVGTQRCVRGTVTFDASYPTGGEAFTAAQLGLTSVRRVRFYPGQAGTGTDSYVPVWNQSTSAPKVLAFMGDNNNASDGPLIEVANTTDLSTLVVPFDAFGY